MAFFSCKVEYIATPMYVCRAVWLMNLMKELCSEEYEVVTFTIDKLSSINLAKNLISHERRNHIQMRFHYLRELVSEGKLKLGY